MITISIKKPLYDDYVFLSEDTLLKAIRYHQPVEVKIPGYSRVIDAEEWLKKGKLMEKVFRRPNEPLRLVGNHLKPIDLIIEDNKQSTLL